MATMKASGDANRHLCPLPRDRSENLPAVFIKRGCLLVGPIGPRPHGLSTVDEQLVDALKLAVICHAAHLGAYSWIYARRLPVIIEQPDPSWLKRWMADHFVTTVPLPAAVAA